MDIIILRKPNFQFSETTKVRLPILIRLVCIFLFVYTAHAKIVDHDRFLKGLTRVHIINGYALYISWLVPIIEIIVSLLLLIPQTAKQGLIAFIGVMILFTGYILSAMIWEPVLPCLCGGAIEKLSWSQHVWFNLAFILLAILALRLINFINIFKKQQK
ncbi:hypothetical protein SAMN05216464_11878 [Mucilaginibacter pineti]|uniref:Methylamine utilisation protein MauE domain-containing protein n=1 Tax=Mucilaginibacter pineti TaxID=1391627 RepID=A0A1G7L8Q0_9SPHI|nr:MauE/DoxX family redox-associated membrane protein [Mucilaginibacter pineti]SDF45833.1 hypothetical protein SAMN05216464_11878 [Mucilaginibacter pineti]